MNFNGHKKVSIKQAENFLQDNFSSPTHWPEWNLLVSKYFKTEFYYLGTYEERKLIGICPVHETKSGALRNLNSGQFHFIPNGGWIFNKEIIFDNTKIPIPFNARFECFSLPLLKEFGINYYRVSKYFKTLIIDLQDIEKDIWSGSINAKRRNMIRKGLKSKIIVKQSNINEFYNAYSDSAKRNGLNCLPVEFFKELLVSSPNIRFSPFLATYNGSTCGFLGLVYDKNYAIYWLGGTTEASKNLGQSELLQWEAIRFSKSYGCKYYDLCYIEKERLPGIYEFKKGFSTNEIEVAYFSRKTMFYRILNRLYRL